ncbi:AAA family ATPase [Myroides sp. BIT-d1]|uniref:AAA family ATPase n=1 Tax=Myroides albus TaxID=2562892 RepID=A0A6I3LT39_9FLAO|nr:ATP-binding protein [Myroides albus]MTG99125.1 AAA family ATPase [Myroides albus]
MVIQFSVGNYRSFYDKRTISFIAKGISEHSQIVFKQEKHKVLPSLVIYGANSSGKSNVIRAFGQMRHNVLNSVKLNSSDELEFEPFLLYNKSEYEPTFFEIVFLTKDERRFRYGFEHNSKNIINEWLFVGKTSKDEKPYFIRTEDGIGVSDVFEEGKDKVKATNDNRLFVSLVAQLGGETSQQILDLFSDYNILSGIEHNDYESFTKRMLAKNLNGAGETKNFFQVLNLGFKDINAIEKEFDMDELPEQLPKSMKNKLIKELTGKFTIDLKTIHNKFDKKGNVLGDVIMDKDSQESEGTNKVIDLSGPIFDTLLNGKTLIIDELDAKLHPLITMKIVELFNNPSYNTNKAQLLFATHDTNLLGEEIFRRDQIWFTEKDECEQTDLYSLYDITLPDGSKVRNDANLERNYIKGRYGAIPYFSKI